MPSPAPAARPSLSSRIDGIDLLRGLAIFFVLMNHVNIRLLLARIPYTRSLPAPLLDALVWNGQRGVQVFFAVSGFLITSNALRRWGSPSAVPVRSFYLLRLARIAPLLLTLLEVLSFLHAAGLADFVVKPQTGGLPRALFAALTFHVNVLESRRGYLPASWDVLWSLSVEETFYLFFPWVCRFAGRARLLVPLLLAFVAAGPFARTVLSRGNEVWRETSYLGGMDAIALGCLTALLLARAPLSLRALRASALLGSAILVLTLGFPRAAASSGLTALGLDMTLLAVGVCLLAAASSQSRWHAPRFLAPLLILGRASYEVYLLHMFAVFALFHIFIAAGAPLAAVPLLFAASILASALLGLFVAYTFSEPANQAIRARFALAAPAHLAP